MKADSSSRTNDGAKHSRTTKMLPVAFLKNSQLKQRVLITRIHFDLDRRYTDEQLTPAESCERMSEQQAMDLFNEVVLKIQSHYVTSPNWDLLLMQGHAGSGNRSA